MKISIRIDRNVVVVLLLALSFLGTSCSSAEPEDISEPPDFVLPDTNGEDWQLANFRGKVVAIYFIKLPFLIPGWEDFYIDELNKIVDQFGDNENVEPILIVFGLDLNSNLDAFLADNNLKMKVLFDNNSVSRSLDISLQNFVTLFVDKSGFFHKRTDTFVNSEEAQSIISDLLNSDS